MRKRIWTVTAGLATLAALLAVPGALAAYTSTKLEITQTGTTVVAKVTSDPIRRRQRPAVRVFAPAGTTADDESGAWHTPRNRYRNRQGTGPRRSRRAVAGAYRRRSPGAGLRNDTGGMPPRRHAARNVGYGARSSRPAGAIPIVSRRDDGHDCRARPCIRPALPASARHPRESGWRSVRSEAIQRPRSPSTGVFSPVPLGAWIGIWTPYTPGTGRANVAGTIATPAAIAPGAVNLAAKRTGLGARLSGVVTQAGQARGGATVAIFGGRKATGLKRLGRASVADNGRFAFKAKTGTFFRADVYRQPPASQRRCAPSSLWRWRRFHASTRR